jgi:hypothetical protein
LQWNEGGVGSRWALQNDVVGYLVGPDFARRKVEATMESGDPGILELRVQLQ